MLIYLLFCLVAGLTFYVLALALLALAFVADRFLREPDNVSFLADRRGLRLLQATSTICLLAMFFALDAPGVTVLLMAGQLFVSSPLNHASFQSEVFRTDRVASVYWLLWLTIPATFGAAILGDLDHMGSWSQWGLHAILRRPPSG